MRLRSRNWKRSWSGGRQRGRAERIPPLPYLKRAKSCHLRIDLNFLLCSGFESFQRSSFPIADFHKEFVELKETVLLPTGDP